MQIVEVGPRDGLQNEKSVLPAAVKVEFIDRLGAAGLTVIEATSFVNPRWMPQLADADEVFRAIARRPGVRYPVLVPNETGLARALAAGVDEIAVFGSATETFARRNLAQTLDGQFEMFAPVVAAGRDRGHASARVSVDVLRGPVGGPGSGGAGGVRRAADCWTRMHRDLPRRHHRGGNRRAGRRVAVRVRGGRGRRPTGWACTSTTPTARRWRTPLAALRRGITTIDSSAGGLGGCPYAKSATGNLATEDLVWMLTGLGIEHGVDLDALVATSVWMAARLGRPSPSAVVRGAGAVAPADPRRAPGTAGRRSPRTRLT